jgi:hypothetical protein
VAADGDLLLHPEDRIFKGDGQVLANVVAALCPAAPPAAAASATSEQVAEAEHLSEQIAEVHLLEAASALSAAPAVGEGVMAEAVVGGALLLVAQNRIGFAALLEALLGRVVVGIAVGVVL